MDKARLILSLIIAVVMAILIFLIFYLLGVPYLAGEIFWVAFAGLTYGIYTSKNSNLKLVATIILMAAFLILSYFLAMSLKHHP